MASERNIIVNLYILVGRYEDSQDMKTITMDYDIVSLKTFAHLIGLTDYYIKPVTSVNAKLHEDANVYLHFK